MDEEFRSMVNQELANSPKKSLFELQGFVAAKKEEYRQTRQSRRQKQVETLENQVKELSHLLGVTTNALEKAATLMGVISPDTAQRFNDVLQLVNERKLKALGKLD